MFKRLTARFVVVKNSIWGFFRMLISTFSLVIISVSSDTIAFWFRLAIASVGGTASRNWAETYTRVLINFTKWKQEVAIQIWFHIGKQIQISHVLNFWAERYTLGLINFTNWKQAVAIQVWFHIGKKNLFISKIFIF